MSSYKTTVLTPIPLPTSIPDHLPFLFDDFSLALHLGVRCKTVWYCITNKKWMYKTFTIPKANGKRRTIHDPQNILKYIQRRINKVVLQPYPLLDCVGAYVEGKGCRDSALRHAGHGVRIGLDIKDFFPTHHRTWVRNFFSCVRRRQSCLSASGTRRNATGTSYHKAAPPALRCAT
jgi:hypothetical protein